MSQMKLQSLIFLCPVCNITKYVNIQKYINNILNVNKHKLTCPLCINNYTGINNLIIHIITDHKTLLSINDGNVSVNLNNFAGNHIITNVETICGDLKIRETCEKVVHPVELENSLKNIPYVEDLGLDPDRTFREPSEVINTAGNELIILESIPNESYVNQITTLEDSTKSSQEQEEISSHYSQVEQHVDHVHNGGFIPVQPDCKVTDELCFMENGFCDKFYDDNKFKDNPEIDGLKFDIDQFLNEMSNANSLDTETNLDTTASDIHPHKICMDVNNQPVNGEADIPIQVTMENVSGEVIDRNNFIWDIGTMNQLFNMNQMNLLQTNIILQESARDSPTEKFGTLFIENSSDTKPMQEDMVVLSQDSDGTTEERIEKTNHPFEKPTKSFQNAFYENLLQRDAIDSKRLKSHSEPTKPNRLRLFRDKQNKCKNQRLEKLQFLTMNKKFEDHLCLDETRKELDPSRIVPVTSSTYEIANVKNETEPLSHKRQNEQSLESSSKYARTLDYSETPLETDDQKSLFKCETCNFYFQNADILAMHNQLLHSSNADKSRTDSHKCKHCSRVFNMKGSLMIHLKVAHLGK